MTLASTTSGQDTIVEFAPLPDLLTFSKAVADEVRLRILHILRNESFGVLELCEILAIKQSALSHHLKILSDAQLLTRRREGNSIFYSRNAQLLPNLSALQSAYYACVDSYPLDSDIAERIHSLQQAREQKSQEFFRQNVEEFAQNQELVAPVSAYSAQLKELLTSRFDMPNNVSVLEIGPGNGEFIPELVRIFSTVDVIDNSPEMLKAAEAYCAKRAVEKVNYIAGDTQSPKLVAGQYDCVVMNMVLHHNASPSGILADSFRVMRPGGRLFVSELAAHQQDWVRESCGDIWLGFNSDDLSSMAIATGFEEGSSCYYAQRNGFVVLIKEFIKPE